MDGQLWLEHRGTGPIMATAVHAGHEIRGELQPLLTLDEAARAREEDPYTDYWVKVVPTWLVARRSRFEVDLNRTRDESVYADPEMAWGMHVWEHPLDKKLVEHSLQEYDAFYSELEDILKGLASHHRHFIILDLHSYNHRREGPEHLPADPGDNPEVNIGTGSMDRKYWAPVVERFITDLREYGFYDRHLDVRENIKFKGRRLAQWIHQRFPKSACVIAIEFKKFFMDEWTGVGEVEKIQSIRTALQHTLPGQLQELARMDCRDIAIAGKHV